MVAISPGELETLLRAHNITAPPQRSLQPSRAVDVTGQMCTFTSYVGGVYIGSVTAPLPWAVAVTWPPTGGFDLVGSGVDALFYATVLNS